MFPDWAGPVAHYVLHQGLPGTLHVGAIAVVGSALVGVVFGTLLTIDFLPSRSLIRLYIEVFRGLPILVTVFIVFFGLPAIWTGPRSRSSSGAARKSPRRRAARCSRSRASSTRRPPRSASTGPSGTPT